MKMIVSNLRQLIRETMRKTMREGLDLDLSYIMEELQDGMTVNVGEEMINSIRNEMERDNYPYQLDIVPSHHGTFNVSFT
tara:strand:+ start:398 stop:637 length:240 start_codon:yes stop_codon:yes gene_type:complete